MHKTSFAVNNNEFDVYFDASFSKIKEIAAGRQLIFLTDQNVFGFHQKLFDGYPAIVIKAGEEYKDLDTVTAIIGELIEMEATRDSLLVGVGGGVITDITGFIGSVFLRGISFGFIPTTLLAMIDAAVGGKNGVDVGLLKNMVGTVSQPEFILYDLKLLATLPEAEWRGGFAEIIKHACIMDADLFSLLEKSSIRALTTDKKALAALIKRNVSLKMKVVSEDELEKGMRKHLNFGHTLGHALENYYQLSHGEAISIGMTYASLISQKKTKLKGGKRIVDLLQAYGLPTFARWDEQKVMDILKHDKKMKGSKIQFVLLEKIGKATVHEIALDQLAALLK